MAGGGELVVSFGEMLIDFVPTVAGVSLAEAPAFLKAPAGAPANVAIAVARLGGAAAFAGKLGDDDFGRMLAAILRENGVDDSAVVFDAGARTALAFITLRADGERQFMFYRNPSADMLLTAEELNVDLLKRAAVFHYGSISLIAEPCRSAHLRAMEIAKEAGALLSYDPNLREALWPSLEEARTRILSIWDQADIVKVSQDELQFLTGIDSVEDDVVMKLWRPTFKLLLVTLGAQGCKYYARDFRGAIPTYKVQQVDSTSGPYTMMRPSFPPRPMPPVGVVPIQRPPIIPGIRGAPPMVAPPVRPPAPAVTPLDKPPTAVYVGKIAPTVDNDFLLSLLRICGPVKSWKRTQNPSNGKPVAFGFCEFESAEGILRATRLLNKLSIDGQELVVNINDATKEYLKKHVEEKKKAHENAKENKDEGGDGTSAVAENESLKLVSGKTEDVGDKDDQENTKKFGIVTNEDSEADKDAAEQISSMIEEWLKTRPPPPPPPPVQPSADISSKHNGESGVDMTKTDSEDKNDDDIDKRVVNETEKTDTGSPDRRKDREHDKEKREKEKELQRYERERERERVRRDRDKEQKHREVERLYKDHVKEWESREKDKEYQRQYEKEREKEKERERKREIVKQEEDSDEEDSRKRRRKSSGTLEERKRRRQREKQEDLADKLKEEEEIAEARRRAIERQQQADEAAAAAAAAAAESATFMEVDGDDEKERNVQNKPIISDDDNIVSFANGGYADDGTHKDNNGEEASMPQGQILDIKQNCNAPAKKLGFGLIGSGKRTSVPSVFAEEDDEDSKDKQLRPLVPIDYSTEELHAVEADPSAGQPNIVAAAEFAKRILVSNQKEEKVETEKDRSRRSTDRSSQRDKSRNDEDGARISDERREKMHDRQDKPKSENKKILDAKQLIDMIPRTKEELFSYDINWAIYEKHELHDRMRPWISKKIIEFLGEEESTLVEYIVSCTKDHVHASKMLELLQSILDVEAEMFVLKMWRMLIFEIKKVEAGLSGRGKA